MAIRCQCGNIIATHPISERPANCRKLRIWSELKAILPIGWNDAAIREFAFNYCDARVLSDGRDDPVTIEDAFIEGF